MARCSGQPEQSRFTGSVLAQKLQRAPIRQQQWGTKTSLNERFVVEDKNAATHLVRNALGGKDQDQLSALLTLPSPFSRRYRDDLTVEVIFFGEGTGTGNVTRNQEASAAEDILERADMRLTAFVGSFEYGVW